MTSTLFDERAYDAGIREAMDKVIAASAPPETIRGYLDRAHDLGRHFERSAADVGTAAVPPRDD